MKITFWRLVQLILIVLKVCNCINWSWYIVLIPFEIYISQIFLSLILFFIDFYKFKKSIKTTEGKRAWAAIKFRNALDKIKRG